MMFCRKCGAELRIKAGAKYCGKCGTPIKAPEPVVTPKPEPKRAPEPTPVREERSTLISSMPKPSEHRAEGDIHDWFSDAGDL